MRRGRLRGSVPAAVAGAQPRERVVLDDTVAVEKGRTYTVVLKPGGREAVRSGPAGVLYAWVPLGARCCWRRWWWRAVCCGRGWGG